MITTRSLHPSDQTSLAYSQGNLDDASAESVRDHLESCSYCRRHVAELTSDRSLGGLGQAQRRPGSPGPLTSSTDRRPVGESRSYHAGGPG